MEPAHPQPAVDCHTHIFCWGENPADGYFSENTRNRWLTRLLLRLLRIHQEPGATLSEKMRNRYLRQLHESPLDYAVCLAQDCVHHPDGTPNHAQTHFYVANDYVLKLAQESPKVLPGCSINPIRRDALPELERVAAAGCRLVKVHTAIQGVDPQRADFEPFYRLARDLGVVLMFHTGYEHSCKVVSQQYADPARLARALDQGGTIIAAHCGTCGCFDRENFYPNFIQMLRRYDNLYGDTAIMASLIRWFALRRLERQPPELKARILHGSDYPLLPTRLPYLLRIGLFPPERHNAFSLDLRIKRSFTFGPKYECQILDLLNMCKK